LLRKIINTFGSNIFIAILNLLIAVVVSQYLGAAGKGQQSIIITTIALVLVVCNIAGGASLVYLIPRYNNIKIVIPAYIWSVMVVFVVYFILQSFNDIPSHYNFHICLLTLINSFTAINSMVLLGHERIHAKNLIAVIQTLLVILTLFFLFSVQDMQNVEAYIAALYVGYTLSFIISCFYISSYLTPKTTEKPLMKLLSDMFKYGFLNQMGHITQLLSIRLSYYILLTYLGEDKVGIYSNAVSLAEAVWLVSKSIATVQYARIANTQDIQYAQTLSIKLLKTAFILSFFVLLPLVLLPPSFYEKLFGSEFGQVSGIIMILAPGVLIYNFAIILGHYFSGRGQYHINTFTALTGLLSVILLCYLLIPVFGVNGAAMATSISFFVMAAFCLTVFTIKTKQRLSVLLPAANDIAEAKKIIKGLLKKEENNE